MPYWVWSILAILIFFPVQVRVVSLFALQGLRFQRGWQRLATESEVPEWEKEVIRGAGELLEVQGFRFVGFGIEKNVVAGDPDTRRLAYYESRETEAWAVVRQADSPTPQCPFLITYISCFTNGKMLATVNMEEPLGAEFAPYLLAHALLADDWDQVWKVHGERHREMGALARAERIPLEALVFLLEKCDRDIGDGLRDSGFLVPASEGRLKLSPRALWEQTRRLVAYSTRLSKIQQAWLKRARVFPLSPRAEAESYIRSQRTSPEAGGLSKAILVVISLLAVSLVWGKDFSISFMASFLIVLTLHEMGHALVMRWVGYRNVNIFFIPFFGAIATGSPKSSVSAWKEAMVLLAGPVPGLILGAWVISADLFAGSEFAYEVGFLAIGLNAFNLLPISPLDGGRVMDLILFRRSPRLGQGFLILSAIGLAAFAYFSRSPVLGVLSAVILLSSGKTYRQAKLVADWRKERARQAEQVRGGSDAEPPTHIEMVTELFKRIRGDKPALFVHKAAQLKAMLESIHIQSPGVPAAFGLLLLYLSAWVLPLFMLGLTHLLMPTRFSQLTRADLEAEESVLYDGLCADSAVVDIRGFKIGDSLTLSVRALAADDTSRLHRIVDHWEMTEKSRKGRAIRVSMQAPIWGLGGLDSTLLKGLVYPGNEESEEEEESEVEETEWKPPSDSLQREIDRYHARLDSLGVVEAGIWRAWPADRKRAWLESYRKKLESRRDTLRCWKA